MITDCDDLIFNDPMATRKIILSKNKKKAKTDMQWPCEKGY